MLENNNKTIIKRLSNRNLKANKMKNFSTILAIILTSVLLTVTLTGILTFYNNDKLYKNVEKSGFNAEGSIVTNKDNCKALEQNKNVEKIFYIEKASLQPLKNKEFLDEKVSLYASDGKELSDVLMVRPIKGGFPKTSEEVLLPTWVLEVLNIKEKVGEKVTLDILVDNEVKKIDFTLCGYYESVMQRGSNKAMAFVSPKFIDKYNPSIINKDKTAIAFVNLKNLNKNSSFETAKEELKSLATSVGSDSSLASISFVKEDVDIVDSGLLGIIISVIVILLIIILSGYLIIYNVFYIAVVKDIKFYGLLKTIGTTKKQIKKIILRQGLILSSIGIPVGVLLGYLVGYILTPIALEMFYFGKMLEVSKSPIIFIFSIVFSLITVLLSCRKPGKIAGKVSPIEAVKYVQADAMTSKKKTKKGTRGAKLHKMALSNIKKSKKKVALSVFSIALSSTIFILAVNIFLGVDPVRHADSQLTSDFEVEARITKPGADKLEGISMDLYNKLSNLDFIDNAKIYYGAKELLKGGKPSFDFEGEIVNEGLIKNQLEAYGDPTKTYLGFSYNDDYTSAHLGIGSLKSEDILEETSKFVIDGKIDKDEFKKGNYIILFNRNKNGVIKANDKLPLTFIRRDEKGNERKVKEEFIVMAVVTLPKDYRTNGFAYNLSHINIEENKFKSIYTNYDECIQKINLNLKKGVSLEEGDKNLSKLLLEDKNTNLRLSSKYFFISGMKKIKSMFTLVGLIVAGIFGFIGALNIVNTVLTGIFSRKIEFATLEAIGMTKKQIKKMLTFEGLYYTILSLILVIPLGYGVSMLAPYLIPIYGNLNMIIYLISILIVTIVIILIIMIFSILGYNFVSKTSVVTRLRDIE